MWATLQDLLQTADAERQHDGRWTVHCEGRGNPGKLYNCDGETEFEAIEDAWRFVEHLTEATR